MSNPTPDVTGQRLTILSSKLLVPPPSQHVVRRERLERRLDNAAASRLTLISAPAGFGKTTLLGNWIHANALPTAWVTLDAGDNEPTTFWSYVIAAMRQCGMHVRASLLRMLNGATDDDLHQILTALLNDLTRLQAPHLLVLDNYHFITTPAIHDSLGFLLDHLPAPLRLIICSRSDPPWALARLRTRLQLSELRAEALRFTPDEATCFFNNIMGLTLTAEQITTLEQRTEGWIAGLQMAALALQAPLAPNIHPDPDQFVAAFSGTNRFIFDYLMEEVLATQPPDVVEFLVNTAVLNPLSGALADAVTGQKNGTHMLVELDRANLFVVPLDHSRTWYRYHALFADLLQTHLQQRAAARLPTIHQRASDWYAQQGLLLKAVEHAVAAEDFDRTERLLLRNMFAATYQGGLQSVARWLNTLPDAVMAARPWLQIAHAWVLAFLGRPTQTLALLDSIPAVLTTTLHNAAEQRHARGHIAAIQAYLHGFDETTAETETFARTALTLLPDTDLLARGMTNTVLAIALRRQGKLDESVRTFERARAICLDADEVHLTIDVLWETGVVHHLRGDLQQALDTCRQALDLAHARAASSGPLDVTGYTHELMGRIALEHNQLDDALRHARTSVRLCRSWGMADALIHAYQCLAQVQFARGSTAVALQVQAKATRLAARFGPYYRATAATLAARYRLASGSLDAAAQLLDEALAQVGSTGGLALLGIRKAQVRVLIAQNNIPHALAVVDRILDAAQPVGAHRPVIRARVLQALAHQQAGDGDTAVDALCDALRLAEPRGFVRVFVAEGQHIVPLLQAAQQRGVTPAYIDTLLAAIAVDKQQHPPATHTLTAPTTAGGPELLDPLSEREMDVLRLLVTGLSSTDIAARLHIAPSTVRSHIKHIYSKLDVHNRLELAETARRFNLV